MSKDQKVNYFSVLKVAPVSYFASMTAAIVGFLPHMALPFVAKMAYQQLKGEPHAMTWKDIAGETIGGWIQQLPPISHSIELQNGISRELLAQYLPLTLVFVALTVVLTRIVQTYCLEIFSEKVAYSLRNRLSWKLLSFSLSSFQKLEEGTLTNMVGEDLKEARHSIMRMMGSIPIDILHSVGYLTLLFLIDAQLFLLFFLILVPCGAVIAVANRMLRRLSKQGVKSQSVLLSSLLEKMKGWQSIRSHGALTFELAHFHKENSWVYNIWRRSARVKALTSPLVEWLVLTTSAVIIVVALRRIAEGALNAPLFTQFLLTAVMLATSAQKVTNRLNSSRKGLAGLRRISSFLQQDTESPFSEIPPEKVKISSLEMSGGVFQYGDRVLFRHLNLKLRPAEICVIKGASGSGKSTLLRALLQLEPLQQGRILWNGHEAPEAELERLCQDSIYLPQFPTLFSGSVLENVIYPMSLDDVTEEDRKKVMEALQLSLFPYGLQAPIEGLSGGEKQRLMFARAFFHAPTLWILDESTSALDVDTERRILDNIKKNCKNSMVLAVAHRPMISEYATSEVVLS